MAGRSQLPAAAPRTGKFSKDFSDANFSLARLSERPMRAHVDPVGPGGDFRNDNLNENLPAEHILHRLHDFKIQGMSRQLCVLLSDNILVHADDIGSRSTHTLHTPMPAAARAPCSTRREGVHV